ncbi:unnamed protein product [Polarella glacialis]|uniref:Glycosyl transferase family 25 domain-containing protein n=1 Tax=Polarella glacialis TaxID=89957 RepID=A0A813LNI1_POLGL|nr:unnamed protein product [Polarella glacialis]
MATPTGTASPATGKFTGAAAVAIVPAALQSGELRRRVTGKRPAPADRSCEASSTPNVQRASKEPMRTLVINLDRRKDRWESMRSRLNSLEGLETFPLRLERFPATDGSVDEVPTETISQTWTTDRNAKYDGRPGYRVGVQLQMTPGERGCAMSHVRAWRSVAASTCEKPVLILEDDAVPSPTTFLKRLARSVPRAAAAEADLVYLGYIKGAPWRRQVAPGLHEAEYLWTTVSYVLWPSGARKLLACLPVDEPIDNFMGWLTSQRRVLALAAVPQMVTQELEWDQGSDVPHSDVLLETVACNSAIASCEDRGMWAERSGFLAACKPSQAGHMQVS